MKYTMKKTIAFLLTLVMLVNILPVSVMAEQPEEGENRPDPCRYCKYSEICGKASEEGDED